MYVIEGVDFKCIPHLEKASVLCSILDWVLLTKIPSSKHIWNRSSAERREHDTIGEMVPLAGKRRVFWRLANGVKNLCVSGMNNWTSSYQHFPRQILDPDYTVFTIKFLYACYAK